MIIPSRIRALPIGMGAAAAVGGAITALHYYRLGLTLSHYDARGHLVVARRVIDSITPGWQQIGAVWLPLPHLLNLLPVQFDVFYRTGASAVMLSILAFAVATAAIAWIVIRLTGCTPAALVAAATFALNPNVLYLQSTPMTEPLLIALIVVAVGLLMDFSALRSTSVPTSAGPAFCPPEGGPYVLTTDDQRRTTTTAVVLALACLTRYEAWPVVALALIFAAWALWRAGDTATVAVRRVRRIAFYPALAIIAFLIHGRVVGGEWFTASGFFVPENKALGRPIVALAEIWWGTHALSGTLTIAIAAIGLAAMAVRGVGIPRRGHELLALSLLAAAALPWAAFVKGHPFRIRYMVPLLAAQAIGAGSAIALGRRAAPFFALVAALAIAYEVRPLDTKAPMVLEAQWDRPNRLARQYVTDCVQRNYDGDAIMASMGSLGHYMQEMAKDGFDIRNFLHEGNGDIWLFALERPLPYAAWIMIEEKAEGGDMLAKIAREHPAFLEGYDRICEGAGVALYRRRPPAHPLG